MRQPDRRPSSEVAFMSTQPGGWFSQRGSRARTLGRALRQTNSHFRYLCQFINFGPENFIARDQIVRPGAASSGGRQHLLQPLICFERYCRIRRLSSAIILWLDSVGMRGKSESATVDRVFPFCERLTSHEAGSVRSGTKPGRQRLLHQRTSGITPNCGIRYDYVKHPANAKIGRDESRRTNALNNASGLRRRAHRI
jgi:hypothetical protein